MAQPTTETQENILDAVMAIIVRDGVRGASMRSVAEEADVSLGLISYHFDDKRTLIKAAFTRATDRLLATSLDAVSEADSPEDRVRAYIRGAFEGDFLDPQYLALRVSLWAVSRTDPEIAAVEDDLYQRYAHRMAELIRDARPPLSGAEATNRATDVIVTQNGLWLNWARYGSRADLERGLSRCEAIALD